MMRIAALFVLCLTVAASASSAQPPRATPPCDRACLEGFVDRYLEHWASLLRSDFKELATSSEIAPRDLFHRRLLFSRDNDPLWRMLDSAIGESSVDRILAALTE